WRRAAGPRMGRRSELDLGEIAAGDRLGPAAPARSARRRARLAAARARRTRRLSVRPLGLGPFTVPGAAEEIRRRRSGAGRKVPAEPPPAEAKARRAGRS